MTWDLEGYRALVCGGSQGIGKACAKEFARRGAAITLVARDEERLRASLEELPPEEDQDHRFVCADFRDPDLLRERVEGTLAQLGPHTILLNNTGGPPAGPLFDASREDLETAFRMHVVCNQILVRSVVPGMKERGYGRIINIVSTSVREPIANLGVSNTIRASVAGWAKTLSQELGPHGITINNILPGYTSTERLRSLIQRWAERDGISEEDMTETMRKRIPLRRFASPEEIASAAGFLASPEASYITGVSLPVDGGRLHGI